jgi:hypothetical protein
VAVLSSTEPRTRRAILFGALGGLGALAARSIASADPADAAGAVQLGVGNTATSITSVRNTSGSASAIGFVGSSTAASATGLQGVASGSNGKGVYGSANTGSNAMGVYGAATQGHGVQGYGVIGVVGNGTTWGVYGNSGASNGIGVNAIAVGTNGVAVQATGGSYGVHVKAASVYAFFNDPGPTYGVYAQGSQDGGDFIGGNIGVYGQGPSAGVSGYASAGTGSNYGVYGSSASNTGVGVRGDSTFTGVHGTSGNIGVQGGSNPITGEFGVAGYGSVTGVYGQAPLASDSFGMSCSGNMLVSGTINPTAVVQQIDHPQDPEHKWLAHALIAAPEPLNVYSGTVTLDGTGAATVKLPGYFAALNGITDLRYQLTAIGASAPNLYVAQKVTGNRFGIAGGVPGQEVSWLVSGVRQDAYAAAHPLRVETRKSRKDQGTVLFVPKGSKAKPMQFGPRAVKVPGHPRLPHAPRPPVPTR